MMHDQPASGHLTSDDRIDEICDAYEAAWQAGNQLQIATFLARSSDADRPALFCELLLLDVEYRQEHGEQPSREKYLQLFPEFAEQIEAFNFKQGFETAVIGTDGHPADYQRGSPSPGHKVAQFELLEWLGTGGTGEVWKARDTRLQRTVAIKVPRSRDLSEAEMHRFLREGRAVAQLQHPNIVPVHDVGRDGETVFIVSDYIAGENLRDRLSRRRLPLDDAAEFCAILAEAVHHAHEQGIVHRDLKPANVLVDRDGEPHITDFGLAKWTSDERDLTLEGQLLGTLAYMAPEQACGEVGSVDRRTDVYALGVLLYEMLTGRCPFQGDEAAVIHSIVNEVPAAPRIRDSRVPRDLETICLQAIEKDPARRYATAQTMAADLRRFLRGEPIFARRASKLEKGWRWIRRRPAVAASIASALLAIGSLALAGRFAEENHALLGLRTVTLATDPPRAKVAFVPLSETTGEPQLANTVYAPGSSPLRADLRPGDYLVVADLPDGRFHEVFRHVPGTAEPTTGSYYHRSSRLSPNGILDLPKISIPSRRVTDGMAFVNGSDDFVMGVPGSTELPRYHRRVASFFIDTTEFTARDFKKSVGGSRVNRNDDLPPDDFAVSVDYDRAVAFAEDEGKRLPSEVEYEFAATNRGSTKFPWGSDLPESEEESEFGPVRNPSFDRLATDPPVYGLCSNKAEWTSSWAIPYASQPPTLSLLTVQERRIVRGGALATVKGDARITEDLRDPRNRCNVERDSNEPGLGFRCVRSAEPTIKYKDFP